MKKLYLIIFIFSSIMVLITAIDAQTDAGYYGFCYGPYRTTQSPYAGIYPSIREIKEDLRLISKFTGRIRTYGTSGTLYNIPYLAKDAGIDCYVGVWLGKDKTDNEKEIRRAIKIAKDKLPNVKGIIVGNEVALRGDMPVSQLCAYIKRMNDSTTIPVGTAESYGVLLKHNDIAKYADFLMVHIHPYWESKSAEGSTQYVCDTYDRMVKLFKDKKVIVGETGFPSDGQIYGKAVPDPGHQFNFFKVFTELAKKKNIPYFYFDVFDEDWKQSEGEAGRNWGAYNLDGSLKPEFSKMLPAGFERTAHTVLHVNVNAPFSVYSDGMSDNNYFEPTGYMGDFEKIKKNPVDRNCTTNPHSGSSCIKITYSAGEIGWAGIYWQYPINNWGNFPGYKISGAKRLTFWARGETGKEWSKFKAGGINDNTDYEYHDSFGPVTTGAVRLTKYWRMYTIDLNGQDMHSVIGGFCWTSVNNGTIFLDDIKYER